MKDFAVQFAFYRNGRAKRKKWERENERMNRLKGQWEIGELMSGKNGKPDAYISSL